MENPCDLCIVKVNCTQICWQKINNKNLLMNAINQLMIGKGRNRRVNDKYLDQYQRVNSLYNQCITDMTQIKFRQHELSKGKTT